MGQKEEEVQLLLLNGEDMLARCGMNEARHLLEGLGKLKERMQETKRKADRKKVRPSDSWLVVEIIQCLKIVNIPLCDIRYYNKDSNHAYIMVKF